MLSFHPTKAEDISQICKMESTDAMWICPYSRAEHLNCLDDPDHKHISIWENESNDLVGFILLKGLTNANQALEFRRIVISKKGRGYGRISIQWIKRFCFVELGFHRLWLDVFTDNERAQHLYTSEGFKMEGTLRDAVKTANGFRSLYLLSMLKGEYEA